MNINRDNITALDAAIKAVCPSDGVDSNGNVSFKPEATQQQKDAAAAVVAQHLAAPEPAPLSAVDQAEVDCQTALNGGGRIDYRKLIKAKFISDLAFRLGKAPGALTNAELGAERNRIAAIYKTL